MRIFARRVAGRATGDEHCGGVGVRTCGGGMADGHNM